MIVTKLYNITVYKIFNYNHRYAKRLRGNLQGQVFKFFYFLNPLDPSTLPVFTPFDFNLTHLSFIILFFGPRPCQLNSNYLYQNRRHFFSSLCAVVRLIYKYLLQRWRQKQEDKSEKFDINKYTKKKGKNTIFLINGGK